MTSIARRIIGALQLPLGIVLGWIRGLEQELGPEDDWVEDDRRYVFEYADLVTRPLGRPAVQRVGLDDWTYMVPYSPDEVEVAMDPEYQRNLVSTRKFRVHDDAGKQWAVGSYVQDPADKPWQHHVVLFPRRDGGTDIYAHLETSVRDPVGHISDGSEHGDPHGFLLVTLSSEGMRLRNTKDESE